MPVIVVCGLFLLKPRQLKGPEVIEKRTKALNQNNLNDAGKSPFPPLKKGSGGISKFSMRMDVELWIVNDAVSKPFLRFAPYPMNFASLKESERRRCPIDFLIPLPF
ncbi:MAG: hypothetical protein NTY64_23650 [Deltaproteobacteria bacterium]|nr:hypothetical protein [Deltaproteobacteria bacterium]